jgi:hypothetical protein
MTDELAPRSKRWQEKQARNRGDHDSHDQPTPETEEKLRTRAAATGKDVDTFVREVIEEKLHGLATFDEVLCLVPEGGRGEWHP